MLQAKSVVRKEINNHPYLFVNPVFSFFPISFILGTLIVNLNLLLFCCLGIYYLKSKVVTTKFNFPIKIIFLFFLIIFFSTGLNLAKTLYFEGYEAGNFVTFTKSILFFRFFLFLIIIYLLSKFNILRFKYFFLTGAFASILISLDIIYQYIFGFNIIGLKNPVPAQEGTRAVSNFRNSSFFGDEYIAGGYIQRFSFFAIFSSILLFKNNNYTKFIFTLIIICVLGAGILFSGNRMPLALFILGLLLVFLFNLKIKKILFISLVALLILLKFIISSNEHINQSYAVFFHNTKSMMYLPTIKIWSQFKKVDEESSKIKNF